MDDDGSDHREGDPGRFRWFSEQFDLAFQGQEMKDPNAVVSSINMS